MDSRRLASILLPLLAASVLIGRASAQGRMAAISDDGRVYTAVSDAFGAFTGWTQIQDFAVGNQRGVVLDHFDADGYPDLVAGRVSGSTVALYKFPGLAGGGFGARTLLAAFTATGGYVMDMASGDFNGDGLADLAVNTNSTATAFVLSAPGGGYGTRMEALETGNGRGMDAGDLDGDGFLDLVRARCCDGMVSLYRGDGAGDFTFLRTIGDAGTDPYGVAVADFNSDGHLDVLANEGSSGNLTLWRGNGTGAFLPAMTPTGGADLNNHVAFDAFDYNGDGRADLAIVNYSGQAAHFVPGLGDGNFGAAVRINPASPSAGNLLGVAAPPYRHPRAPVARATPAEQTLAAGDTARFDGSGSSAPDGTLTGRIWFFGDGAQAEGAAADHTYTAKGRYWPVHRVTSSNGLSDLARVLAIVTGPPPTAHAGGPYTFTESQALNGQWTGQLDGRGTVDDGGRAPSTPGISCRTSASPTPSTRPSIRPPGSARRARCPGAPCGWPRRRPGIGGPRTPSRGRTSRGVPA